VESAKAWAGGYEFPEEYLKSDVKFLQSQMLDFTSMLRRRLFELSQDWLSVERVKRLRADNPERGLLLVLVGGMKVHQLEEFTRYGAHPWTHSKAPTSPLPQPSTSSGGAEAGLPHTVRDGPETSAGTAPRRAKHPSDASAI
jgi:hypothetical protein